MDKPKKDRKFDWTGVQNSTAASILTGISTPFILTPFDVAEVTQNAKPLSHLPKNTPLRNVYKELFTNPKVLKEVYTKAVPARLIKNIPAQAATLGSFALYKELLDHYNPPVEKLGMFGAVKALGRLASNTLDMGVSAAKSTGKFFKNNGANPDFWNTFINLPNKNAKALTIAGGAGFAANLGLRSGLESLGAHEATLTKTFKQPKMSVSGMDAAGNFKKG